MYCFLIFTNKLRILISASYCYHANFGNKSDFCGFTNYDVLFALKYGQGYPMKIFFAELFLRVLYE